MLSNKRKVDKTKKSNIKCEHCGHWCQKEDDKNKYTCTNPESPKHNTETNYWNRCKAFSWKD